MVGIASSLVTTAWLAARLDDPDIQGVDATWFLPSEPGTGRQTYGAGHIPGAVFFDIDEISDRASPLPHMLPTPEAFATAVGDLGLSSEASIAVYDAEGLFSAPRVWWTLRAMGFPKVFVLDGGLRKWRAEGRSLSREAPRLPVSTPKISFQPELMRNVDQVRAHLERGDAQLVDARAGPRFRGEAPEPRAGVRLGHMPGALNVPWGLLVDDDGALKSKSELRAALKAAAVDLSKPIVTTCGSGVTAAVLALALTELGLSDVAVYDGSWAEWGGRTDTPVVTEP